MRGESFPENAAVFYAPMFEWVEGYLASLGIDASVQVDMEIIYFNSSTSKIFINFFRMLERAVKEGKSITVTWRCSEENENAIECGEEFREDLAELPFQIVVEPSC